MSDIIDICVEQKICLENQFPGILLPVSFYDSNPSYQQYFTKYSNLFGVSFYEKALKEKIKSFGEAGNRLILHKNVMVVDKNGKELMRFPQMLFPTSDKFIIEDIDDHKVKLSLRHPPTYRNTFASKHASGRLMDLARAKKWTELEKYATTNGYPHNPHKYEYTFCFPFIHFHFFVSVATHHCCMRKLISLETLE